MVKKSSERSMVDFGLITTENFEAEKHYKEIVKWWKYHNFSVMPLHALSDIGIVLCYNGDMVCASWLYTTNSSISWLEFYVSNPEIGKEIRNECLERMIDMMIVTAKHLGFKSVFSSIKVPKLIERLEARGFMRADENMTNMLGVI